MALNVNRIGPLEKRTRKDKVKNCHADSWDHPIFGFVLYSFLFNIFIRV